MCNELDEALYITGSLNELGSWNIEEAPIMICIKPGLWSYALVVDKRYFEACKVEIPASFSSQNIFQFTFFLAEENPLRGRTVLKLWNPNPSHSFIQKRGDLDELVIECNWDEIPPNVDNSSQESSVSPRTMVFQQNVVVSNNNPSASNFPPRIKQPFSWYSLQRSQVIIKS